MKRIVVASDLSIRSDRAVGRAVRIAARLNVGLTALHVVDSAMPSDIAEMVNAQAKTRLESYLASIPGSENVDIEVNCAIGDPVEVILDTVQKTNADLLILGVHRSRAFLDAVRETTMERLVRTSAMPVLLVTDAADHDYAKVLGAVDMSPACTKAISFALRLAPAAEFSLVHGLHIPFKGLTGDASSAARMQPYVKEAERAIDAWITKCTFSDAVLRPLIIEGSPAAALSKAMSQSRPDLLVMGVHSRTGLGRMVLGSFTADLIRDPPCDLLVAR